MSFTLKDIKGAVVKKKNSNGLLPCPFCGNDGVYISETGILGEEYQNDLCSIVMCSKCGGSMENQKHIAISNWNERYAQASVKLRLNREKLVKLLEQCSIPRIFVNDIADAIIAADKNIVEIES